MSVTTGSVYATIFPSIQAGLFSFYIRIRKNSSIDLASS